MREVRYDMAALQDISGVKETKWIVIHHRWKLHHINMPCKRWVEDSICCKPPNPEKIQPSGLEILGIAHQVHNIGMKYTDDSSIQKAVFISWHFWVENHDITMRRANVNHIFIASDIVCHIVEPHSFVSVNVITVEYQIVPVDSLYIGILRRGGHI